jgi:hypothetical protein
VDVTLWNGIIPFELPNRQPRQHIGNRTQDQQLGACRFLSSHVALGMTISASKIFMRHAVNASAEDTEKAEQTHCFIKSSKKHTKHSVLNLFCHLSGRC